MNEWMKVTLVKCKCCTVSEQGLTSRGLFGSSLSDRLCTSAANRPQDNQIYVRALFNNLQRSSHTQRFSYLKVFYTA